MKTNISQYEAHKILSKYKSKSTKDTRKVMACKECGCTCPVCVDTNSLDLHQQIEELRSQLVCSHSHITQIEHDFMSAQKAAEVEVIKLREELYKLRDRYERLFDSHKNLQKLNNALEDKMLSVVNKYETEKLHLQQEVAHISSKLADAKLTICDLEYENQRYHEDCNMAVQLLQCKPSNFVAQRLNSLPIELQERVKRHMTHDQLSNVERQTETKIIRVPMPTFPPTAMVYSVNDYSNNDLRIKDTTVPMTLIAKVLKPREAMRKPRRTYVCNKCLVDIVLVDQTSQTDASSWLYYDRIRLDSTESDV